MSENSGVVAVLWADVYGDKFLTNFGKVLISFQQIKVKFGHFACF